MVLKTDYLKQLKLPGIIANIPAESFDYNLAILSTPVAPAIR